METLKDYLKKLQLFSFTMMIELHAEECKSHVHVQSEPESGRRSIVASDRKTAEEDEIPDYCHLDDMKTKWLEFPGLPDIYN